MDKTAGALRIYEYVDEDGVVFWSFTLLAQFSVRRLRIVSMRGEHYRNHISEVHKLAFQREILEEG